MVRRPTSSSSSSSSTKFSQEYQQLMMAQTAVDMMYKPTVTNLELVFPRQLYTQANNLRDGEILHLNTQTNEPVEVDLTRSGMNIHCHIQASTKNLVQFVDNTWHCELGQIIPDFSAAAHKLTEVSTNSTLREKNVETKKDEEVKTDAAHRDLVALKDVQIRKCSVSLEPFPFHQVESIREIESGEKTPKKRESVEKTTKKRESGEKTPKKRESGEKTPKKRESGEKTPKKRESGEKTPKKCESGENTPKKRESGEKTPKKRKSNKPSSKCRKKDSNDACVEQIWQPLVINTRTISTDTEVSDADLLNTKLQFDTDILRETSPEDDDVHPSSFDSEVDEASDYAVMETLSIVANDSVATKLETCDSEREYQEPPTKIKKLKISKSKLIHKKPSVDEVHISEPDLSECEDEYKPLYKYKKNKKKSKNKLKHKKSMSTNSMKADQVGSSGQTVKLNRGRGVLIDGHRTLLQLEDVVLHSSDSPKKKSHKKKPEPLDLRNVVIRDKSGEITGYTCPNCEEMFGVDTSLLDHFYKEHLTIPRFSLQMLLLDIYFYDLSGSYSYKGAGIDCPFCNRSRDSSVIIDHIVRCHHNKPAFRKIHRELLLKISGAPLPSTQKGQCPECSFRSPILENLLEHVKNEHQIVANYLLMLVDLEEQVYNEQDVLDHCDPIVCPYCYKARTRNTIYSHISWCHEMMPDFQETLSFLYGEDTKAPAAEPAKEGHQCPDCPVVVNKPVELYQHYRHYHSDIENYLENIQSLEEHLYVNYTGKDLCTLHVSKCIICDKMRDGRAIFDHIHWCHENIPEHVQPETPPTSRALCPRKLDHHCPFCSMQFKTRGATYKHSRYECSKNPQQKPLLSCRFCAYHCDNQEKMEKHIDMHQDRYVCETCGAQFQYKSSLCYHKRRTHGQGKAIAVYTCPVCNHKLSHKSSYKRHLLTHSGQKNHTCEYCGKAFSTPSALRNHRNRIHLGAFPYHCDKCGYGIYKLDLLRKHRCGRIRNRGREVGAAKHLRMALINGTVIEPPKHPVKEVTGWKKKQVQGTEYERMPTEMKFPRNLDEFFHKQVEKEAGDQGLPCEPSARHDAGDCGDTAHLDNRDSSWDTSQSNEQESSLNSSDDRSTEQLGYRSESRYRDELVNVYVEPHHDDSSQETVIQDDIEIGEERAVHTDQHVVMDISERQEGPAMWGVGTTQPGEDGEVITPAGTGVLAYHMTHPVRHQPVAQHSEHSLTNHTVNPNLWQQ